MTSQLKKTSFVGVRFLPEEKQRLQEIALQESMTLSNLVRAASLCYLPRSSKKVVPEINRKAYFELGKISELIQTNQLTLYMLLDLYKLLNEVRRELLGLKLIHENQDDS
jgi:hypothetical protein